MCTFLPKLKDRGFEVMLVFAPLMNAYRQSVYLSVYPSVVFSTCVRKCHGELQFCLWPFCCLCHGHSKFSITYIDNKLTWCFKSIMTSYLYHQSCLLEGFIYFTKILVHYSMVKQQDVWLSLLFTEPSVEEKVKKKKYKLKLCLPVL